MTRDLGSSAGTTIPPAARRAARPAWRDPRLWLGVLLVTGSVVLGARLLAAADDTVAVWAMTGERGVGTPVAARDLVVERVRFADDSTLGRYFAADRPVPDGLVLVRTVGEGELLARSAVGVADEADVLRVPLEVDPHRVPPDVVAGSVVDVWLTDGGGAGAGRKGADGPALDGVTVVAAPAYDDTFAVGGARQLVVAVEDDRAATFEALLGSLQDPVIRILQRS
ncbi:hypothetical protein [Nocardioides nitrophenolicus]|uniref:hypothetical protein n=1 Tax=Nocardioides nitrophenolicus TaxID=60489 RepID=UPI001956D9F0|nr:hypothetical protein [Nocardioides nitrophenolicus]MBM7515779.1 hypothetical protein [Nocardioides nitrophenolicus]